MRSLKGILIIAALAASSCGGNSGDPRDGSPAADVLAKAGAIDRLRERTAPHVSQGATAPSFVVDPGWPKPLPHGWIIGDIGGLFVDRHDNIWVYHRPRALDSSDTGALGVAGKNAKGDPISALGHLRPYGQISGCCVPAPSVLEFDKAGNLLKSWGGPSDPGFLENKCREKDGCFWPSREHGIFVDHNDFV